MTDLKMDIAADISKATTSILDIDELLSTSVNLVREKFNLYYVGLFLVDEDCKWAVLRAGSGRAGQRLLKQDYKLEIGGQSLIGQCIIKGQPHISDTQTDPQRADNPVLPKTRSEAVIPLVARDSVTGAMSIQSKEVNAFPEQDVKILQTIADQLAIAIENARLFEDIATSQRVAEDLLHETIALQQLSQALSGTLRQDEILDIFFNTCTKVLGFDFVIFSLADFQQSRVEAIGGFGVTQEHLDRAIHPLDSDDIMADIIRTGHTELVKGWDSRFDKTNYDAEGMGEWGVRVFTPVRLRQENIGLVEVGFNRNVKADIEDAQIRLLRAIIDQTALALENAKRHEASQRAIRHEALLKEITTRVRASTNLDTILQTAVKEIGDALGSKRAYVHLVTPTNDPDL
jgi:GAF domain-containing protein